MKEILKGQSRFYRKWTIQRRNKWKYLLMHGTIYWVLFGLILLTTETIHNGNGHPWKWVLTILLIAGAGIFKANADYQRNEKIYQTYFEDDPEIVKGVMKLETGLEWIWENLTIQCVDQQHLILRNNLFWLQEEHPAQPKLMECMQTLRDDLDRLRKNKEFAAFAENKLIQLQLFNNLDKSKPILEEKG